MHSLSDSQQRWASPQIVTTVIIFIFICVFIYFFTTVIIFKLHFKSKCSTCDFKHWNKFFNVWNIFSSLLLFHLCSFHPCSCCIIMIDLYFNLSWNWFKSYGFVFPSIHLFYTLSFSRGWKWTFEISDI